MESPVPRRGSDDPDSVRLRAIVGVVEAPVLHRGDMHAHVRHALRVRQGAGRQAGVQNKPRRLEGPSGSQICDFASRRFA